MKDEIGAAVVFLSRLIKNHEQLSKSKLDQFRCRLEELLIEQFQDHWFPENPFKGQGYRCIRVNETERMDPILKRAAEDCGLNYNDLNLPSELTIWVDPTEVCCRLGEYKGSYCTVAKFKNGNKENYANQINIEHLERKSAELAKQASAEIMSGFRRNRRHHNSDHSTPPRHHFFSSPSIGTSSPVNYSSSPVCSNNFMNNSSPSASYHQDLYISNNIRRNLAYGNSNINRNANVTKDDNAKSSPNKNHWGGASNF